MATWHADFVIDDWRVSPKLNRISKDGQSVGVKHKSMAVLVFLADAGGDVVTRDEIMDGVWPGMEVTDDVLTQSIVELRKAFRDDAKHPRIIETIPRVGFRLVATIQDADIGAAMAAMEESADSRPSQRSIWIAIAFAAAVVGVWMVSDWRGDDRNPVIVVQDTPSIAVLPFSNLSDDPGSEYFSDGMSDEIRNLLGQVPGLKVIGRTSSYVFKNANEDIRHVGQQLGITSILEGSVRKSDDRVRISMQLIDTSDGTLMWSDTYERTITDIFAVQNDVATRVIDALQILVASNPAREEPTDNPEAYQLFLKARAAIDLSDYRYAERLLKQTISLDPEFAEAHETLAFNYWMAAGSLVDVVAAQQLIRDSAAEAVRLNPRLIFSRIYERAANVGPDYRKGTIEALDDAIRIQPNHPMLLESLSWLLVEMGYLDESLKLAEHYAIVDPLSLVSRSYLALGYYSVGRNDEAIDAAEFVMQSKPAINPTTMSVVGMLLAENRDEAAIGYVEAYLRQQGYPDTQWFRELVTEGRDPAKGQSYLDDRIAEVLAAMPEQKLVNWSEELLSLYLYLGYLDRYHELVLETEPTDQTWHYAGLHAQRGVIFRQHGYTAHPDFLTLAELLSIDAVWEHRGAPDFCDKKGGEWVCD